MKKTLIALAVAALVAPGLAAAEGATVSGLANISYVGAENVGAGGFADKTDNTNAFGAAAEVDVINDFGGNVTGRVDIDTGMGTDATASKVNIEQAFFAYKPMDKLTVIGGIFNNPLNYEHQDAGARILNSQGQIAKIFDNQTALYQNNVAGVAGAMNFGMVNLTVGVLDQLSHAASSSNTAQNSYVAQVGVAPVEGLNVKLGYVTQDTKNNSSVIANAGNVLDLNAEFKTGPVKIAAEYISAEEIVDTGMALYASFMINDQIGVGARYDTVSYQATGAKDTTSTSLNAGYQVAKNLKAALEYRSDDNGTNTNDSVRANFLVKY